MHKLFRNTDKCNTAFIIRSQRINESNFYIFKYRLVKPEADFSMLWLLKL